MIKFVKISDDEFLVDNECAKTLPEKSSLKSVLSDSKHTLFNKCEEFKGANNKWWFVNNNYPNRSFLFKSNITRDNKVKTNLFYGEILTDLICRHVGIDHTPYYLCEVKDTDGNQISIGTMSPDYLKQHDMNQEMSAKTLNTKYQISFYDNNNGKEPDIEINTVYEYIKQIEFMYSDRMPKSDIEDIKQYMLKVALLDYLTIQTDRHWGNYGIMYMSNKGIKSGKYIPMYDNEVCFFLDKRAEKLELLLNVLESPNITEKYRNGQITALTTGKDSTPILGIKTSLVQIGTHGELVKKKNDPKLTNLEIFIDELAQEILANPSLHKFYDKLKTVDIVSLNSKNNDVPGRIATFANTMFNKRMLLLGKAVENRKGVQHENG